MKCIKEIMQQQHQHKRKNRHNTKPEYKNLTPFKEMEKHFKLYQNKETDFTILYSPEEFHVVEGYQIAFLPFPEGAILVKQFNSPEVVLNVAAQALNTFWRKPYRTNLNSREELYKMEQEQGANQQPLQKIEEKQQPQLNKGYTFNEKIRWANVGYQYDWTERKYPNVKTVIPEIINELCVRANKLYNSIRQDKKNYYPQSAIINYYGEKDYMTGHLDDAQLDQLSPIYSFSFGLSCIFLIGGRTKQEKPISVRLNSGDLLIMGLQARKCYHGVPRILSQTFLNQDKPQTKIEQEWINKYENIQNYLKTHRININVRQVYPTED